MAGARSMIQNARSHLDHPDDLSRADRFAREPGRPGRSWCADFVAAVARESGNAASFPDTDSCAVGRGWFADRGRLSRHPAVGAQVFFGGPGHPYGPGGAHTGLCIAYTRSTVTVIAGNTDRGGSPGGDGVHRRVHRRPSAFVDSFGYPAYPEGLVCADAAWRGRPGVLHLPLQATEADLPDPAALVAPEVAAGVAGLLLPRATTGWPTPGRDLPGPRHGGPPGGGHQRAHER
ncbi:CHAP domain-containing protein [Kitasatospora paranensis]|uniref:CHAP domain-containing protein n=1 Tax=Kitasatospora paranensis TaxID=258053 RepID=A0ABW2G846_9ACTN